MKDSAEKWLKLGHRIIVPVKREAIDPSVSQREHQEQTGHGLQGVFPYQRRNIRPPCHSTG